MNIILQLNNVAYFIAVIVHRRVKSISTERQSYKKRIDSQKYLIIWWCITSSTAIL